MDNLTWLQKFYLSQCDGDWEHQYGIKIDNLDNPGWSFEVDLYETVFENDKLDMQKTERSENDWLICKIENYKFIIYCGPKNLEEAIGVFRKWVDSH